MAAAVPDPLDQGPAVRYQGQVEMGRCLAGEAVSARWAQGLVPDRALARVIESRSSLPFIPPSIALPSRSYTAYSRPAYSVCDSDLVVGYAAAQLGQAYRPDH